jgi:acetolactate synthase-1/2/3 large subunit
VKNELDGGEAILEAIRNLGIDYVISSPGSEWPPFWEALARQKINNAAGPIYLDCGHETLAVGVAHGYSQVTGRMQAVLLHAGSGLLQGSMAIQGARASETPMLVMSGESLTYGERQGFDPGNQWYRNLGVVGGPQRLIEPIVKWSYMVPSPETLYQSVIRVGEMAARVPQGPVYLNIPIETMMQPWSPPARLTERPPAPKLQPVAQDIQAVAQLIRAAKTPIIITETAGRDPDAFHALIKFAELMSIPVFEGRAAANANFPKSHPLHQGSNYGPYLAEVDLALLVASRVPWYPPKNSPQNARIVAIDENPLKDYMVYQSIEVDIYLQGTTAQTLELLTETMKGDRGDADLEQRHARWAKAHGDLVSKRISGKPTAKEKQTISTALLCHCLNECMPAETIYVDETIVHSPTLRDLLHGDLPHSFFRVPSGLGQGLSMALGIKLAARERPVVLLIGDGSFLYNPVLPALTFSRDQNLPILIVICNNNNYEIMRKIHLNWYPHGVSAREKLHFGVHINGPDYSQVAGFASGKGLLVKKPADLDDGIRQGLAAVRGGQTAIINVVLDE